MSGLDFVFQFSSKGDANVNEKVEELKKSIQDLQKELEKAVKTKEQLQKGLGDQTGKTKAVIQSQIDMQRKAFNAEKRNVDFLEKKRSRGMALTKQENNLIERFYGKWFKFDKEKIKELKDSDKLNLQSVQKMIEGKEKIDKVDDKNHKKETARYREKMRLGRLVAGGLKLAGAALGITLGAQYLREQFGKEFGSQMTGSLLGLPSNFLVGIGQASRKFGGTPEDTQKAVAKLQSDLNLMYKDPQLYKEIATKLALTGLTNGEGAITSEELISRNAQQLLSGIARAYQMTSMDEKEKQDARIRLANFLGSDALANMLTSGEYESLISEYSNKPEKENMKTGAEVSSAIKANIEDAVRSAIDYFWEVVGEAMKSGIDTAIMKIMRDANTEDIHTKFKGQMNEFLGGGNISNALLRPVPRSWEEIKDFFSTLFGFGEIKAGEDISNTVNNGNNSNVTINNTYEDNSSTSVNSVDEANQSKEGRADAANIVFNTGKKMAMGSSLQTTGIA